MDRNNRLDRTPPPSTSERIRKDFSFAQVFASVLSTVTCMALAPKIGLLGGLLGGAIGAGVAACATQLYRSILNATTEKLKYKQQQLLNQQVDSDTCEEVPPSESPLQTDLTGQMKLLAEESLLNTMGLPKLDSDDKKDSKDASTSSIAQAESTEVDSEVDTEGTLLEAPYVSHLLKYVLVIVGVTMLSVILSVAIISYATQGEGLGKKPDVVYITKYVTQREPAPEPPREPVVEETEQSKPSDAENKPAEDDQDTQDDQSSGTETPEGENDGQNDSANKSTEEKDKADSVK